MKNCVSISSQLVQSAADDDHGRRLFISRITFGELPTTALHPSSSGWLVKSYGCECRGLNLLRGLSSMWTSFAFCGDVEFIKRERNTWVWNDTSLVDTLSYYSFYSHFFDTLCFNTLSIRWLSQPRSGKESTQKLTGKVLFCEKKLLWHVSRVAGS